MRDHLKRTVRGAVAFVTAPRTVRGIELAGVVVLGVWLGLLVAGHVGAGVGPVETRMSLSPALTGDSVVNVSPLGSLSLDSHDGPVRLTVDVQRIDIDDARTIFDDPAMLDELDERVVSDVRRSIGLLAVQGVVVAALGAGLLALLVFRRLRRALLAAGIAFGLLVGTAGLAAITWNPKSVLEPRYSGLLASAPSVVGTAESIVQNFETYRDQLAKLVTNVSRLYDVTSTLGIYQPDPDTIRILHVSDLHLSPHSWGFIQSIVEQFQINAIIDSGDFTDHGSAAENYYTREIASVNVPYVWVRGNHDSMTTQHAVAEQPNAIVLDGDIVSIPEAGELRVIGQGDPRFTPDRADEPPGGEVVEAMGQELAQTVDVADEPVDVAVVHDAAAAGPLDGEVALVLAGHAHQRSTELLPSGTRLFIQGSTGGAGLRALESGLEEPTPVECSILYFDRETKQLQAWDDITIGGLGLASAEMSRHLAKEPPPETDGEVASETTPAPPPPGAPPSPEQPATNPTGGR